MSVTTTTWSGFWRQGKRDRWQCLVADAPSYDDAWGKLLDITAERKLRNGECLVTDRDPNEGSRQQELFPANSSHTRERL